MVFFHNLDLNHTGTWKVYLYFLANIVLRVIFFLDFFGFLERIFLVAIAKFEISCWFALVMRNQRLAF